MTAQEIEQRDRQRFFRYADKYFETPESLKVHDLIAEVQAEYKNPSAEMTLPEALHLMLRLGYLMKLSHIDQPKV